MEIQKNLILIFRTAPGTSSPVNDQPKSAGTTTPTHQDAHVMSPTSAGSTAGASNGATEATGTPAAQSEAKVNANEQTGMNLERILYVDPTSIYVYTIALSDKAPLPSKRQLCDLEKLFDEKLLEISDYEPFQKVFTPPSWPDEKTKLRDEGRRDHNWSIIEPIVSLPDDGQFDPEVRGPKIGEVSKTFGIDKKRIYDLLRKFWQLGQVPNALLPWIHRKAHESKPFDPENPPKKRGRYSELERQNKQRMGPAITDTIREKFKKGIEEFYINRKSRKKQHRALRKAYKNTCSKYFSDGLEYSEKERMFVPRLLPRSMLPTFRQFQHYYYTHYDPKAVRIECMSEREYNLGARPLGGNATLRAYGPGSLFEIDSTPLPVELGSRICRADSIGKATLYLVVDVFSHLIAGYYLGAERASFMAAALAMLNAASDKVEHCRSYGIPITEADWPARYLAERVFADRGELKGLKALAWVRNLIPWLETAPPYRPDLKPFVERLMQLLDEDRLADLPGVTPKMRKRGDGNPKDGACLDSYDMNRIVIHTILDYNHKIIRDYPFELFDLDPNNILPRPTTLFIEGQQLRGGHLRKMNGNLLRANLLPEATAYASREGIKFGSLRYLPRPELRSWLARVPRNKEKPVTVNFHSNINDYIYWRLPNRDPEPCFLAPGQSIHLGKSMAETEAFRRRFAAQVEQARQADAQYSASTNSAIAEIIRSAKKEGAVANGSQRTKGSKRSDIRRNHSREVGLERVMDPFRPTGVAPGTAPKHPTEDFDYIPPDFTN